MGNKRDIPPGERLTPFEWHHAWLGLILAALGFIVLMYFDSTTSSIIGWAMSDVGILLFVEDRATHLYQKHVNPEFVGYVHRAWEWARSKAKGER